jgi:hypothetical protein
MTLSPRDWRCAMGRDIPGTPCARWSIPGVVSATTCYRHMTADTRAVLGAMS